ncbi:hypothetical protein M885DRAFT_522052 [Pelagophyceae sp. CCMP2097]|nr:hypothetical protein M885DRAFT_522052 [Pelagophyceae sp. CCMP2097]
MARMGRRRLSAMAVAWLLRLGDALALRRFAPARRSAGRSAPVMISERAIPKYLETMKLYEPTSPSRASPPAAAADLYVLADVGGLKGPLLAHSRGPLFSAAETSAVIDECEAVALQNGGWGTQRHSAHPTTDVALSALPSTLQWFREDAWPSRLQPFLAQHFGYCLPDAKRLKVVDAFVAKYDAAQGQSFLAPHRDGAMLSFNVALNGLEDYADGGTWFKSTGAAMRSDRGKVLGHASAMLHGGAKITAGTRYVLVAFVILETHADFAEKFSLLVRERH